MSNLVNNTREYYDFIEYIFLTRCLYAMDNNLKIIKKLDIQKGKEEFIFAIHRAEGRMQEIMAKYENRFTPEIMIRFEEWFVDSIEQSVSKKIYFPLEHMIMLTSELFEMTRERRAAFVYALRMFAAVPFLVKKNTMLSGIVRTLLTQTGFEDKVTFDFLINIFGLDFATMDFRTMLMQALNFLYPENVDRNCIECDDIFSVWLENNNSCFIKKQGISYHFINDKKKLLFYEDKKEIIKRILDSTAGIKNILIKGNKGCGKKTLINELSDEAGKPVIYINGATFYNDAQRIKRNIDLAIREAVIYKMNIAVTGLDNCSEQDIRAVNTAINECLGCDSLTVFYISDGDIEEQGIEAVLEGIPVIKMQALGFEQMVEIWDELIQRMDIKLESNMSAEKLASAYVLTPGQVEAALYDAKKRSDGIILRTTIFDSCRQQQQLLENESAKPVKLKYTWNDIILDKTSEEVMKLIISSVENRTKVMEQWGFSSKIAYGRGIAVLFYGPPGTGKTMAAQVIANELNMELYKVDTSRLIDKYVGETEKNIKGVFKQASKGNYVLFFDEADAIFNKRMDAGNANERFANIESALLLQCMEEYEGLSILATNLKNSMDSAFIRRFKYAIPFSLPGIESRMEIWKSVIPEKTPIAADIDFEFLAEQFSLSGAEIKNITVSAAYMASVDSDRISMQHMVKAIKYELQKQGQMISNDMFGKYAVLFN